MHPLGFALTAVAAWVAAIALYLLSLTAAAIGRRRALPADADGSLRFAILVPAHNERLVIERLLRSVGEMQYPKDRYDVHVVADNCDDETALLARAAGATVHERLERDRGGKGFALRWLMDQLRASGARYGAFLVLDADSTVSPNILRRLEARVAAGAHAVQVYDSAQNPGDSPVAALRLAALAAYNYVRPLGRSALGLSAGLRGNGMCFTWTVFERLSWSWFSPTEDVEMHFALLRQGIPVDFAPEAAVLSEMPTTLAQAASQNERWERGRLLMLRRLVPSLVVEGIRRRSPVLLEAAVEQLVPPLSVPLAVAAVSTGIAMATGDIGAVVLAVAGAGGICLHLILAMASAGAPAASYRALAIAPAYVVWKVLLYARALMSFRSERWVRTRRLGEPLTARRRS